MRVWERPDRSRSPPCAKYTGMNGGAAGVPSAASSSDEALWELGFSNRPLVNRPSVVSVETEERRNRLLASDSSRLRFV